MKRQSGILAWLTALTLLASCGSDTPAGPSPAGSVTPLVVALGDSLTAGPGLSATEAYPSLLQQRARAAGYPHLFVNAGVSGDTSQDAVRRLDTVLVPDTRVLIVALGANDGLDGLPISTIRGNLEIIIERAKARNIRVLLCGMETPPTHGFRYTVDFHRVFPELAGRYGVPLMPFLLLGVAGDPDLNLGDRVHPNAAGMRVIAETMWPYLEPLLK
jgi:acyl-CoA thioesterase I